MQLKFVDTSEIHHNNPTTPNSVRWIIWTAFVWNFNQSVVDLSLSSQRKLHWMDAHNAFCYHFYFLIRWFHTHHLVGILRWMHTHSNMLQELNQILMYDYFDCQNLVISLVWLFSAYYDKRTLLERIRNNSEWRHNGDMNRWRHNDTLATVSVRKQKSLVCGPRQLTGLKTCGSRKIPRHEQPFVLQNIAQ